MTRDSFPLAMPRITMSERWLLVCGMLGILLTHLFPLAYGTYTNVDEAYASALASRLLDGHELYVGAISQRGPAMYYAFAGLAALFGWHNILALRIVTLLWCQGLFVGTFFLARHTLSARSAPIAATVVGYALCYGFPLMDGAAMNGELLQAPLLMASCWLGVRALRREEPSRGPRPSTRLFFLSGLLFGLAACVKQSALLHMAPVFAVLACRLERHNRVALAKSALTMAAGSLVFPALFILRSALHGSLREFFYYTVTYNAKIHMVPTPGQTAWVGNFLRAAISNPVFVLAGLFLLAIAVASNQRAETAASAPSRWQMLRVKLAGDPLAYISLHLLASFFGSVILLRFFSHYFVVPVLFLALVVGECAQRFSPVVPGSHSTKAYAAAAGALLLALGGLTANFSEIADGRTSDSLNTKVAAKYIKDITLPEDRIFVWGFSPQLYGYSQRAPASRFLFSTYLTGFVPWYFNALRFEQARIVPQTHEQLIEDLEREHPKVVVDAGSIMLARSMRSYPKLNTWMHQKLCFLLRIGAYDIYVPKGSEGCAVDAFPTVHWAENYDGFALLVPMPRTLDEQSSRPLVTTFQHRPSWFPEAPVPPMLSSAINTRLELDMLELREENGNVIFPGERLDTTP